MLAKNKRLTAKLTITDNGHTVSTKTVVFKAPTKAKHKRRA